MVRNAKIEKSREPMRTIHFLTNLSARYPNNNIVNPEMIVNVETRAPNGVVSPPNPKYAEIVRRLGETIFETV
jgi:hypothetical protein